MRSTHAVCLILAAFLSVLGPAARGDDSEAVRLFESRVRPMLAERCWSCHGPDKQFAGLRLDAREGLIEGGDSGPVIEPGKPEESLLVAAVRQNGEAPTMPPKGKGEKLGDAAIAAIEEWIKQGAPWPAAPSSAIATTDDAADGHWAFQPVRKPVPPAVRNTAWVANPIDAFILARLEANGLAPSPPAAAATLARRLSFDLIGLPPTPGEVAAFRSDDVEAEVERLLSSPRYGERWGRHWLDVARYADTKGYVFQEERRYPFAYTYRDWVIDAFNRDLPFDQFIVEQLAADQVPDQDDPADQAALGFLTVGRRFLNNQEDILDDRIDVTTRGFLGLTVACARCHDHKYDPIPAADYYSLYGVFASSREPSELPLLDPNDAGTEAYREERRQRQAEADGFLTRKREEFQQELREKVGAYWLAAYDLEFNGRHPKLEERAREASLKPELLRFVSNRWSDRLRSAPNDDPILSAWRAYSGLKEDEFSAKAAEAAGTLDQSTPLFAAVASAPPGSMREVVTRYGELFQRSMAGSDTNLEPARRWLEAPNGPLSIAEDEMQRLVNRADRNTLRDLERKVAQVDVTHPGSPARAMVLVDRPEPYQPYVFLRGSSARRGPEVPRRFLEVLSTGERRPFEHGSGRLDLARAIASPDNPLTARVIVNRVWMHHFGQGLVRSASDFGLRSDPPSHPELLDWLAAWFVEHGWSIKDLHRLILASNTYQQQSLDRPEGAAKDPGNLWLWKQNRQRLELEPLRDSLLFVADRLDPTLGGRPVPITTPPYSRRRTVYGFIDRQNLDGVFRTFDLASPDTTSPFRFETTVPQQALFLMNHPFVAEQARHLAARAEQTAPAPADRIGALHHWLFGRAPEPWEVAAGLRFIEERSTGETPKDRLGPWGQYAQVLMLTNEFAYID